MTILDSGLWFDVAAIGLLGLFSVAIGFAIYCISRMRGWIEEEMEMEERVNYDPFFAPLEEEDKR